MNQSLIYLTPVWIAALLLAIWYLFWYMAIQDEMLRKKPNIIKRSQPYILTLAVGVIIGSAALINVYQ